MKADGGQIKQSFAEISLLRSDDAGATSADHTEARNSDTARFGVIARSKLGSTGFGVVGPKQANPGE